MACDRVLLLLLSPKDVAAIISSIIAKWRDWEAMAMQAGAVEQSDDAYRDELRRCLLEAFNRGTTEIEAS